MAADKGFTREEIIAELERRGEDVSAYRQAAPLSPGDTPSGKLATGDSATRIAMMFGQAVQAQRNAYEAEGWGKGKGRNVLNQFPLESAMTSFGGKYADALGLPLDAAARGLGGDKFQEYQNANEALAAAIMPVISGAAVTETEAARLKTALIPQLGDTPKILARKTYARALLINAMADKNGQPRPFPQVGTVDLRDKTQREAFYLDPQNLANYAGQTGMDYENFVKQGGTANAPDMPQGEDGQGDQTPPPAMLPPGGGGGGGGQSRLPAGFYDGAAPSTPPPQVPVQQRELPPIGQPQPGGERPGVSLQEGQGSNPFWAGLEEGVSRPLDNASIWAEELLNKLPGDPADWLNDKLGLPTAREAAAGRKEQFAQRRGEGIKPSAAGDLTGNIIGTIPAALMTKNPFIGGAIAGGLSTEDPDNLVAAGRDALFGGLGGKVISKGGQFLKSVAPDAASKLLANAGVKLTPGQLRGGVSALKEERRMSLPNVGDKIRLDRQTGLEQFGRGAVNQTLLPLGKALPKGLEGVDAIKFMQEAAGTAFDDAIPGLRLQYDKGFGSGIKTAIEKASKLPAAQRERFQELLKGSLRLDPEGGMTGDRLMAPLRDLRTMARGYAKDLSEDQRQLGFALGDLHDEFMTALQRQNPTGAKKLLAANKAYKGSSIVSDAASRADDANFSTSQLRSAVRSGDASKGKTATARGDAYMQDYARAARKKLPASQGDSGTAGRLNEGNLLKQAQGLAHRGGYEIDKVMTDLLGRNPKVAAMAKGAGKGLLAFAPGAGLLAPLMFRRDDEDE